MKTDNTRRPFYFGLDDVTPGLGAREIIDLERSSLATLTAWRDCPDRECVGDLHLAPLQTTGKSRVYRVWKDGQSPFVAKFHTQIDAFETELFALGVFADGARGAPALLAHDAGAMVLALEHIRHPVPPAGTPAELRNLASALGTLHEIADRTIRRHGLPLAHCSLSASLADVGESPVFSERDAARRAYRFLIEDQGAETVPVAFGDLKSGHARMRDDGSTTFVDLDSVAFGLPSLLDVGALVNMTTARFELSDEIWRTVLLAYLVGREKKSPTSQRVHRYYDALVDVMTSVGMSGAMYP